MAVGSFKILESDVSCDAYNEFIGRYNDNERPQKLCSEYEKLMEKMYGNDEYCDFALGISLAAWETKGISKSLIEKVHTIIHKELSLMELKELGANESFLKNRHNELTIFLNKIQTPAKKRKPRKKIKIEQVTLISIDSPDGKIKFGISEMFENGKYCGTYGGVEWKIILDNDGAIISGGHGSGILQFHEAGHDISAKWLDNSTIEVLHSKNIPFIQKKICAGHQITANYVEK